MAALVAVAANDAAASYSVTTPHLSAKLVAEQSAVRPGDVLGIALDQKIQPHWHTYWLNPGDSGQAPKLDWKLPAGAEAGPIQWPAPDRVPLGPLLNYGYSDRSVLLTDIRVPADWPVGTPFPVRADAELLVCNEICIPIDAKLALDVPTGPASVTDDALKALFAETRAKVPAKAPGTAEARKDDKRLALMLNAADVAAKGVIDAYFFVDTWGLVEHAGKQSLVATADGVTVVMPRGQIAAGEKLSGILSVRFGDGTNGAYRIDGAPFVAGPVPAAQAAAPQAETGALLLILFALAGGLLLNLMPCVFPVLAMKALALTRHADAPAAERLGSGVAYTAGVVISFAALAGALLAARAGGAAVGWGYQLQNPLVVGALAYVVTAIGLNLSGVFEFGGRLAGIGGTLAARGGVAGSFFTGVLATVVAAPCTAPFMAAAAGGALLLPAPAALAVFAAMGFGLALPYLLLSVTPALARALPKPGPWMVRFKQFLAFPMYATAAWLVWVLMQQAGPDAAFAAMLGLVLLAFALWVWPVASVGGKGAWVRGAVAALALIGAAGLLAAGASAKAPDARAEAKNDLAERFTAARLAQLRAEGRPVLVNMTAAWCITCKVNERVALSGDGFAGALKKHGVAYLQGDWTSRDTEITRYLERYGRAGVPLYALYPAGGGEPRVLPQLLDPGTVRQALADAA